MNYQYTDHKGEKVHIFYTPSEGYPEGSMDALFIGGIFLDPIKTPNHTLCAIIVDLVEQLDHAKSMERPVAA